MIDKEEIYDAKIYPLMKELLQICQDEGIPMFATFQYGDEAFCSSALTTDSHILINHLKALSRCTQGGGINIDKYLFWVVKQIQEEGKGHSSIFLQQAGIPIE